MKLSLKSKLFIALISGMVMGLTPAPGSVWYLAWIALAPLYCLINQSKNLKENALLGLIWGCGYHGLALFWITGIHPMTWLSVPWLASLLITIFCWCFITIWGALIPSLWSILITVFKREKKYINILLAVSFWCFLETIWSHTPLWWTTLAYTQSPNNLIILHLGQISGVNTVTAVLVLVNILIGESYINIIQAHHYPKKLLFPLLSLITLIIFHGLGWFLFEQPLVDLEENKIKIGIIQGNIPNQIKLSQAGFFKALENYTKGYQQLVYEGVDLVLTPETALPFFWDDLVHYSSFYQAILADKVPALIGAFGQKGNNFTNSLFLVGKDGKMISSYDKVKLVPLGEYIPFENFLGKIINKLSPLDAHLIPGKTDQKFPTPWGQAIIGICYDSAFGELFRRQAFEGGELIITASNNAHYSERMHPQHHAQDVMRAIETDRWLARATNTGYSAIIDPRGRSHWLSKLNTYQLHSGEIYGRQTKTLYVRWGDWLTGVLIVLSLIIGLFF